MWCLERARHTPQSLFGLALPCLANVPNKRCLALPCQKMSLPTMPGVSGLPDLPGLLAKPSFLEMGLPYLACQAALREPNLPCLANIPCPASRQALTPHPCVLSYMVDDHFTGGTMGKWSATIKPF
eukprot:gene7793-biopygen19589